jgi:MarR family transcriptional regulator for hemolysin
MTKPLSNQEQFSLRIGRVARLWRAEIDRRLAGFGITESRWLTLLHLSRLPEAVTQRELAESLGVQGPTLVRTLDRLEADGLIERRIKACDRRTKSVHLRAEATPILTQIEETAAAVRAEIFADISPSDVTICLKTFEQIAEKLGGTLKAIQHDRETPIDR